MNPGYLSFLLLSITLILLAFGWKEELAKGVSRKKSLLFLTGWTFLFFIHISPVDGVRISMAYMLILWVSSWIIFSRKKGLERFNLISSGLLLGAIYVLTSTLYNLDPVVMVYHPMIDISFILTAIVICLTREALLQFALITIGMACGELFFYFLSPNPLPLRLGTPAFFDKWWLTLLVTRLTTETLFIMFKAMIWIWRYYRNPD